MEVEYQTHTPPTELIRPYDYIALKPGKEIRSKLIESFNLWLQVPPHVVKSIREITAQLHNSSLLIDDIEDNAVLRRGEPVAHAIYGTPTTINCSNYMYFMALQSVVLLKKPEAVAIFTEEVLNLHRGQGYDIYWRDTGVCPSEDEYKKMVLDKTGGLFRLSVRLMQVFSSCDKDLDRIVTLMGLYFQIRDDYVNLQSEEYMAKNKSYCEDLTEGKYSFPIIHHIKTASNGFELDTILKQKTTSKDLKTYAVEQMKQSGAFSYTLNVMNTLKEDIDAELRALGGNKGLSAIMDHLHSNLN